MLAQAFLARSAALSPDKVALVRGEHRLTFGHLDDLSARVAGALRNLGLRRGDRVVVQLESSAAAVVSLFAIWNAGGVAVPVHPEVKPRKLALLLRDSGARLLIAEEAPPAATAGCPALAAVIVARPPARPAGAAVPVGAAHPANTLDLRQLLAAPPSGALRTGDAATDELCCLIYTSGSTGQPRGVMITHANLDAASASILEYLGNTADDVVVDLLPLAFDYGLYNVLMPIRRGATVVLERGFLHPGQLLGLLQREGVTGLPLVPTLAAWFVKLESLAGCNLPSLRYITSTGQVLPPQYIERLRQLFPRAEIYSMYGLTECKRVSYLAPAEIHRRPTSVGKAMPGTEAHPIDGEGRRIDRPGVVGELLVRGPHVMRGYWNLPAETAAAVRPDGDSGRPGAAVGSGGRVLHTGDLFTVDDQGFLYFVARRDDLIKTAGLRVSPKEVESVLLDLDGVAEAAVCGVPDELLGQAVKAVVTPRAGRELTAADVAAHCARHLERHLVPKQIEIRAELPRTATGKVARRELVERRVE
jgi:long-chain acyl-CoA synthetase